MGLDKFKDKNRDELSMIEVARAILEDNGKRMAFADIVNAVQKYLNKSDEEIRVTSPSSVNCPCACRVKVSVSSS